MKALILLLLICSAAHAQSSVARLTNPDGSSGSCVFIERTKDIDDGWIGMAVTAAHVVEGIPRFSVKYDTGRSCSGCFVLVVDEEADLAIIRVWAPDDVEPAKLHDGDVDGDVDIVGYPFGKRGRTEGRFLRLLGKNTFSDAVVMPGYSGGWAFFKGRLIGCISGGWMWMREGKQQVTWPTRAGSHVEIKRLLEEARTKQ